MANYTAGTAYLRIAPSMQGFNTTLRNELRSITPEPELGVQIKPKMTGFKSELQRELRELTPPPSVRVRVTPNLSRFRTDLFIALNQMAPPPVADVRVKPSMVGFRAALRAEVAALGLPDLEVVVKPIWRPGTQIIPRPEIDVWVRPHWRGGLGPLPDQTVNVRADKNSFATVGRMLGGLGKLFLGLVVPAAAVVGVSALSGAVGALTAAAIASVGALALIPALITAIGITVGAVKLGMTGFADTLKQTDPTKFAEGLAKLSPAARAAAVEIRSLSPAWTALRLDVQNALFRDVAATIDSLARIYLPVLRTGLTGTATSLSYATGGFREFAESSRTVADTRFLFDNTNTSVKIMSGSLDAVLRIFRDVAVVGSTFLPGLATGWAGAAQRASEYVAAARESGALAGVIQGGLDALRMLGDLFSNVGNIIGTVWRASQEAGGGFLQTMIQATDQAGQFLNSVNGYGALVTIFTTLRDIVSAFMPGLIAFVNSLATGIRILGPALPPIATAMSALLIAISPLIVVAAQIAAILGGALAQAVMALVPLVSTMASVIGTILLAAMRAIEPLFPVLLEVFRNLVPPLQSVAVTIGNVLVSALRLLAPFLPPLVDQFGRIIVALVPVVDALLKVGSAILNAVLPVVPVLVGAILTLIEKAVIPLLPPLVRLVESILPGVVATINVLVPVIEFLARILVNVLVWTIETIVIPIINFLAATIETINKVWQNAGQVVDTTWRNISTFISDAYTGVIKPTLDFLVSILDNVVGPAFNVLWTIIRIAIGAIAALIQLAWDTIIAPVFNAIVAFVRDVLGPIFTFFWQSVIVPVWNGIQSVINTVWTFVRDVIFQPIVNFINGPLTSANNVLLNNVIMPVWNGIQSVISTVWNAIRDNVFSPLVNFVTRTIPDAFNAGVRVVSDVWNTIKKALRDPIQAVIDVVYNRGIVASWNKIADFVGLPGQKLEIFNLPQYATGGPVTKPTALIAGEAGPEYILSAPAVRNMGGMAEVDKLHKRARERDGLKALNRGNIIDGASHDGPGAIRTGFGGVKPHVAMAGHFLKSKFGIGVVGGVGARGNVSDHPVGLALDFMTGGENGTALAQYAIQNMGHLGVKYAIWRQQINQGRGWTGMADRGSPTANHMDHVHVSFNAGAGGTAAGGIGGLTGGAAAPPFDPIAWVMGQFGNILGDISGIGAGKGGVWALVRGFGSKVFETIKKFAIDKATAWGGPIAEFVGGVASNVATGFNVGRWTPQALMALAQTGQSPLMLPTLLRRMNQESGGNPTAVNRNDINWQRGTPSVGLMQVIGPTFAANAGPYRNTQPQMYGVSTDPTANIYASIKYALGRYGSLPAAYNKAGGYDDGGMAFGRGMMFKNVIAPERTLDPRQTRAFEVLVGDLTGRGGYGSSRLTPDRGDAGSGMAGSNSGGPFIGQLVVPVPEGSSVNETLDAVMTRARHETRRGRYARP